MATIPDPSPSSYSSLSYSDLEARSTLAQAAFGLDIVVCLGALGWLIGLSIYRKRQKKAFLFWNIIASLITLFCSEILNCGLEGYSLFKSPTNADWDTYAQFYLGAEILQDFFHRAALCFLFYIFYRMTHECAETSTKGMVPSFITKRVHWGVIAIVVISSIAAWGLWIRRMMSYFAYYRGVNSGSPQYTIFLAYGYTESIAQIIRWIVSGEILAWNIYAVTKALLIHSRVRIISICLLGGSVFFFALNMVWAIINIKAFLVQRDQTPSFSAVTLAQAIFIIMTYAGLLPFSMKWDSVQNHQPGEDLEEIEKGKLKIPQGPLEVEDSAVDPYAPVEANSKALFEAGNGCEVAEADPAKVLFEADDSKHVNEADSKALAELPAEGFDEMKLAGQ